MMMPNVFYNNFNMLDDVFRGGWLWDKEFRNAQKKLYGESAKNLMSTDIKEEDDKYEMIVDLPGFKKDDITIELEDGYLTISAEKGLEKEESDSEEAKEKDRFIRKERFSGRCKRVFYVGTYLKQEDIKARFEHGVLTLGFPKKESPEVAENKYIAIEG